MLNPKLFHIFVTILCFFQAIIWTRNGWLNVIIKIAFWTGAIWGVLMCLKDFGFLVKI